MLEVSENQGPSYKQAWNKYNLACTAHASSLWEKPQIKSLRYCDCLLVDFFQTRINDRSNRNWISSIHLWSQYWSFFIGMKDWFAINHDTQGKYIETFLCNGRSKCYCGQMRQWKLSVSEPQPFAKEWIGLPEHHVTSKHMCTQYFSTFPPWNTPKHAVCQLTVAKFV